VYVKVDVTLNFHKDGTKHDIKTRIHDRELTKNKK